MKKFFAIALLLCCTLAASGQEKMFTAALKKGREHGEFYKAENTRDQVLEKEAFDTYARQHDYLIGDCETKRISRFGSSVSIVSEYYFLPKNEYDCYLYERFGFAAVPFSALNKKGKAIIYETKAARPTFNEYSNIYWNGSLVDGRLDGKGIGFAHIGDRCLVFDATFEKGFPVGRTSFIWTEVPSREKYDQVIQTGHVKNGLAYFVFTKKYGFVKENGTILPSLYNEMVSDFKGNMSPDQDYAVVVADDGLEWKLNTKGVLFAYSDRQQKILDDKKAAEEEAARKAALEAKLAAEKAARERKAAEQKAAEERRIAMEKQRVYNEKVKENSDPDKWDVGDRLCLVIDANMKEYVTGTIEEWNSTRSKAKIKVITSPGSRRTYNGENLEKNTTMWIDAAGKGWHKALPEEIELANKNDRSTHVNKSTIVTAVKCYLCDGKGHTGSGYYYQTCTRCDGTGFVNETQTITL